MTSFRELVRSGLGARLTAAAIGALAAWLVMQGWYPFFSRPLAPQVGTSLPDPRQIAAMLRLAYLNVSAVACLASAMFATALVLCEAVARRSLRWTVVAVLAAVICGGVGGEAGGWTAHWLNQQAPLHRLSALPVLNGMNDAPRMIAVQAACWALAGLGVGLGLGLPNLPWPGGVFRAAFGGILGGIIAGLLFPILAALLGLVVPFFESPELVPGSAVGRLLWLEVAAVSIAAGIEGSLRSHGSVDG